MTSLMAILTVVVVWAIARPFIMDERCTSSSEIPQDKRSE